MKAIISVSEWQSKGGKNPKLPADQREHVLSTFVWQLLSSVPQSQKAPQRPHFLNECIH